MAVTTEISIFPLDKGIHLSNYVSKAVLLIKNMNINYKLNAMGTVFETDTMDEALDVISRVYKELEPDCERVYCTAKFDIYKNRDNAIVNKVNSIESIIGDVNR